MAELPGDAKTKFDRAYDNLNPPPGPSNPQTPAEATARLGTALVAMSEGLALSALDAQKRLSTSVEGLTAELKKAAKSADDSAKALAKYTLVLAVATMLLFFATAALVYIEWAHGAS